MIILRRRFTGCQRATLLKVFIKVGPQDNEYIGTVPRVLDERYGIHSTLAPNK